MALNVRPRNSLPEVDPPSGIHEWKCGSGACEIRANLQSPGVNAILFRVGALLCLLAVGLGAFGAHALKPTLAANDTTEVWKTAVLYHFLHALALLILAALPGASRLASALLVAGIVIFSGSLYLLALTNIKWLGAITPLGGLCFLAGWLCLVIWPPR
jgi:uncharacterized membrane protein YgdD (TMEM256/DUF423 family)